MKLNDRHFSSLNFFFFCFRGEDSCAKLILCFLSSSSIPFTICLYFLFHFHRPLLDFLSFFPSTLSTLSRLLRHASSASVPEPERSQGPAGRSQRPQSGRERVPGRKCDSVSAGLHPHLRRLGRGEPHHPHPAGGAGVDQEAQQI